MQTAKFMSGKFWPKLFLQFKILFASCKLKTLTANNSTALASQGSSCLKSRRIAWFESVYAVIRRLVYKKQLVVSADNWSPPELRQLFYKDADSNFRVADVSSLGGPAFGAECGRVQIPVCLTKKRLVTKDTCSNLSSYWKVDFMKVSCRKLKLLNINDCVRRNPSLKSNVRRHFGKATLIRYLQQTCCTGAETSLKNMFGCIPTKYLVI